jgi:hypothetical protein
MTASTPETRIELAGARRTIFRHIAFEEIRAAHNDLSELPCPTIREETPELLDRVQELAERIGRWGDVLTQARQDRNGAVFAPVDHDGLVGVVEEFMSIVRAQDMQESHEHDETIALAELLCEAKDLTLELAGAPRQPGEPRERPEDCESCGKPAAWENIHPHPTGRRDALCEDCARWRGSVAQGEAMGVMAIAGAAVALLRKTGLTDSAILAAVREMMAEPEYSEVYDVGGLKQIPSERPEYESWRYAYRAIEGASA